MSDVVQAPEPGGSGRFGVPEVVLALGLLALAAAAALVGVRVTHIALDETLFKASAVRYGQGLPDTFLHDNAARASSRLYALTLMPIFKAFDGDVAVRVAKVWNAALWASTALPAYAIGRRVLRDRWLAVVAALGGVAVPWVLLSTALFSENLAYPAFVWVAWAMLAAATAPAWWRDGLVVLAIAVAVGARVQLVSLGAGYVVVAALACWGAAAGPPAARLRGAASAALRRFPFLLLAVAGAVLVVLVLAARHRLGHEIDAGLGDYGTFDNRTVVPSRAALAALVEVLALGLGVGVLPLVLALGWVAAVLRRRAVDPEGWWLAVIAIALTAALFAFTVVAQNGFIGGLTEERYYVYPVPLVWIAAVAAFRDRDAVQRKTLLFVGLAFALLATTVSLPRGLDAESGFLAPVSGLFGRVELVVVGKLDNLVGRQGLTAEDLLLVVVAVAAVVLARVWDHHRRAAVVVGLGAPALLQLGLVVYGLLVATGAAADGAGARNQPPRAAALGWIDRPLGDAGAQWLDNEPRLDVGQVEGLQRQAFFWNDRIGSRVVIGQAAPQVDSTPLDTLPLRGFVADLARGEVGLPGAATVQWIDSPLLQLVGQRVSRSPDGHYELLRLQGVGRLAWLATGVDGDGVVGRQKPARLLAWPRGTAQQVSLTVAPLPAVLVDGAPVATQVQVRLGDVRRRLTLAPGSAPVTLTATLCGQRAEGEVLTKVGAATVDGRTAGAVLTAAQVRPGGRCG